MVRMICPLHHLPQHKRNRAIGLLLPRFTLRLRDLLRIFLHGNFKTRPWPDVIARRYDEAIPSPSPQYDVKRYGLKQLKFPKNLSQTIEVCANHERAHNPFPYAHHVYLLENVMGKTESTQQSERERNNIEDPEWLRKFKNGLFEIPEYINYTEKYLEGTLGITDLSILEKWWLRKITEDFIPRYRKERQLQLEGKLESATLPPWPHIEIAMQWLEKLYGIDTAHYVEVLQDRTDPKQKTEYTFPDVGFHIYPGISPLSERPIIKKRNE